MVVFRSLAWMIWQQGMSLPCGTIDMNPGLLMSTQNYRNMVPNGPGLFDLPFTWRWNALQHQWTP